MRFLFAALIALTLTACATGSSIVTGTARPAITPDLVRLYSQPPKQYEEIGIVRAESDSGWTSQHDMDLAIAELRRRAALMGANGILLGQTGTRRDVVGSGYMADGYGSMMIIPYSTTMVEGRAIFIPGQ